MKKLVLLLTVFALAFTSCNSDDDATPPQDQFIGTWQFYKLIENGIELELDACEIKSTIAVSADGTFVTTDYDEDFNGECQIEAETSGTWENRGNSTYRITIEGFSEEEQLVFENNTFIITDTYTENNQDFIDETVFIRI